MPTIAEVQQAMTVIDQLKDVQQALVKLQASDSSIIDINFNVESLKAIDPRLAQIARAEFLTRAAPMKQTFYDYLVTMLTDRRTTLLSDLATTYNIVP